MEQVNQYASVSVDGVKNILTEAGFETLPCNDESGFIAKETESGLTFTCDLENDILFNALACFEVDESAMTSDLTRLLLDAENGISTSSFGICKSKPGSVVVTLSNFCKLQDLGHEDRDDILSCLEFLRLDVLAAKKLLGPYI